MPDICMCARFDCPLSRRCHRHAASGTQPSCRQDYFAPTEPAPNCGHFWPRDDGAGRPGAAIEVAT